MTGETATLPPGDYAIVEVMGHRTLVGRVTEVERFGTKLMSIEPLFSGELLPGVLIGGASIYQFTPCTPEVASARQPKQVWQLPASIAATLPQCRRRSRTNCSMKTANCRASSPAPIARPTMPSERRRVELGPGHFVNVRKVAVQPDTPDLVRVIKSHCAPFDIAAHRWEAGEKL